MSSTSNGPQQQQQRAGQARGSRAKSLSDLSNMSEIVEVLAKRLEEIYAQNKLLLASIAGGRRMDGCDNEDLEGGERRLLARCHHCGAGRMAAANYCHKCGCKVQVSSGRASPEM